MKTKMQLLKKEGMVDSNLVKFMGVQRDLDVAEHILVSAKKPSCIK